MNRPYDFTAKAVKHLLKKPLSVQEVIWWCLMDKFLDIDILFYTSIKKRIKTQTGSSK